MHWDGTISVGNVLTFIGIIGAILLAFNRFTLKQERHSIETTAAVNNLAAITDNLQKAVSVQNGRLAKVEITLAVNEEVEKRMAISHIASH